MAVTEGVCTGPTGHPTDYLGIGRRAMMAPAHLFAALAVCAIALAACGSSSKPGSPGSAGTQALKFADCMRASGTPNFPDPGSNGRLPNPFSPAFRAAEITVP